MCQRNEVPLSGSRKCDRGSWRYVGQLVLLVRAKEEL